MPVVTFTGTRELPHEWEPRIHDLVGALPIGAVAVVGVCLGFDALVARLAHQRGVWVHAVVPADRSRVDPDWRRYAATWEEMAPGRTYRQRDERMVALAANYQGRVVAVPRWPEESERSRRSGTWMTVRIARLRCLPIHLERLWLPPP